MSQYSVKFHEDKRHAVYERDGYKCAYCGRHDATKSGATLSIDHITSRESGGEAQAGKTEPAHNLITTCGSCNYSKQAKSPREFNVFLKEKGKPPIDWSAVRSQAKKPIDVKAGEKNAAAAKAFRESKGEPIKSPPVLETHVDREHKPEETGPGIHHGKDGKFAPGHAALVGVDGRPDLATMLAFWQSELRLRDWQIQAEYVKNLRAPVGGAGSGSGGAPVYGLCYPLADNMTALIQIRDPVSSDDGVMFTASMVEAKLVHEVYHCMLSDAGIDPVREERITWATSEALVRLRGTLAGAHLTRAVAARAARVGRVTSTAPRRAAGPRRIPMDPMKVFIAALRALLASEDPKPGIEALISEMEGAGIGGDDAGAPPDALPPPADDGAMPARAAESPLTGGERPARVAQFPLINGLLPDRPLRRAAAPAAKPLTIADVQRVLQEDRQRVELLVAARASRVGMTPALEAHLATRPLAEVRVLVDSLEVKPPGAQPVPRAALAVGAGGAEGTVAEEPTPEERAEIAKINAAFGHGAASARPTPGTWDLSRLMAAKAAKIAPALGAAAK